MGIVEASKKGYMLQPVDHGRDVIVAPYAPLCSNTLKEVISK